MSPLATSHVAHLCNQLNRVAQPNFMPCFKSIIFYYNSSKVKVFLQKNPKFRALGAPLPDTQPLAAGGSAPTPPKQPPHCEFLATRLEILTAVSVKIR